MMQLDRFVCYINEFEPLAKALLEHLDEGKLVSHVR